MYRGTYASEHHCTAYSRDEKLQKELWELSEKLIAEKTAAGSS